jgi:DNA-binding response OmpR family regulator
MKQLRVLKRVQMIILKPFSFEELIERIKIHFRNQWTDYFTLGAIQIDIAKHSVSSNETLVQLTNREFDLLCYLVKTKEKCVLEIKL